MWWKQQYQVITKYWMFFWINENKLWSGSLFFEKNVFIDFLQENNINVTNGKTQHNCILSNQTVKIHGDPTHNHHDWVIAGYDGQQVLCHILCFLNIQQIDTALQFQIGHLNQPGLYAACHFVDQDDFHKTDSSHHCMVSLTIASEWMAIVP